MKNQSNIYLVPLAIIIAGALIGGAIAYSLDKSGDVSQTADEGDRVAGNIRPEPAGPGAVDNLKPITDDDHVRGNPDAPIKIIEFSDTECPFCKRFHTTMRQVTDEYDKGEQVAWVYRHFPLDQLHSKARKEAEATECANELGGNSKFWAYIDRLFEITPSNNNLDPAELPKIAEYVGLDKVKFEECLTSGRYAQRVADDLADAIKSGGQGTPYSIVVAPNGKKFIVSGAQPYAGLRQIIEAALQAK